MALPKQDDIEIPLLEELEKRGGEAQPREIYPKVTNRFTQITQVDLNLTTKQGGSLWENRIQFARQKLVEKGEIDKSTRGMWRITDIGRARLKGEKVTTPTSPTALDEADKLTEQIKSLLEKLIELAKKAKKEIPRPTHDEMVQKVKEMGERLGKVTEPMPGVPFKHDCVWRDNRYTIPKLVVEVCDKGNLPKDILSLDWAVTNWGAKGILVIFDESDFQAAQSKFAQKSQIYPIKTEDMLKFHSLLQAGNTQVISCIFTV